MSLLLTFGKKSVIQRAISVLRKFGTDAHAYIPGGSISTYGPELVTNGGFDTGLTGWTAGSIGTGSVTASGGVLTVQLAGGDAFANAHQEISVVSGKSYKLTGTVVSGTTGNAIIGISATNTGATISSAIGSGSTAGTYSAIWVAPSTATYYLQADITNADTVGKFSNISVKEVLTTTSVVLNGLTAGNYTDSARTAPGSKDQFVGGVTDALDGIHATQGAAGNKPVLRQGPVNLLTYSNDLSNAAWALLGTATKSGSTLLTPAPLDRVEHTCVNPAGQLTLAAVLSGSGTCKIFGYNATNGSLGALTITLTDTPTLYVSTLTSTVANTLIAVGRSTGTATAIGIHSAGVFIGTLTANQILAAGGIPITTSIKASAGTGPQYWEFGGDGTPTDYLGLGSVPFQMSDDFVVVCAFLCTSVAAVRIVTSVHADTNNYVSIYVHTTGQLRFVTRANSGATTVSLETPGSVANQICVVTGIKRGDTKTLRLNGAVVQSSSTPSGSAMFVEAQVGAKASLLQFSGEMYCEFVVKGAITDADLFLVEKLAANLAGVTL